MYAAQRCTGGALRLDMIFKSATGGQLSHICGQVLDLLYARLDVRLGAAVAHNGDVLLAHRHLQGGRGKGEGQAGLGKAQCREAAPAAPAAAQPAAAPPPPAPSSQAHHKKQARRAGRHAGGRVRTLAAVPRMLSSALSRLMPSSSLTSWPPAAGKARQEHAVSACLGHAQNEEVTPQPQLLPPSPPHTSNASSSLYA